MKEVSSLKNEIENIFKLNQKLATEAHELTKALKGDKKGQGNWGELILERVLESSGLREGEEYSLQAKEMGLVSDEGRALRPDVIIKLPEGKHLIIDSKVTLVSYDKYLNSEDAGIQALALKEFTQGIKNHITTLAEKKYQNLDKLQSPDFVLMFIPIEGAFATALQNDGELFKYGWEKKIIIVSPTTLMVTLRTVESIWKQEKQNKYAMDIARQAGDLYDKFVSFIEDLENLKRSIEKSKENLDAALNKLTTGRGNLVGRVEKLKALGAKASKSLSIDFEEHE
jgi:DNA recombination protein RmuC